MRASIRRERTIEVGADAAWAIVGAPDLLHLWFPGIVSCTVEGDRRTITTRTGLAMDETILTCDNLQRRFQYRIDGRPFTEHLGTLDVHELGPGRSLVVYATDAAPAVMAIILGGGMAAALEELARQLESGQGPAIDALAGARRSPWHLPAPIQSSPTPVEAPV
ncbi:MAG TPA: SRPBCC family protein [Acidimicrobiales bacterium]